MEIKTLREVKNEAVRIAETEAITASMYRNNNRKNLVAKELKVSYRALLYKMKDYGIGVASPTCLGVRKQHDKLVWLIG